LAKGEVKEYYSELTDISKLYWGSNRNPCYGKYPSEILGLRAASVRKNESFTETIENLERFWNKPI
jgi:hypothetical protein